MKSQNEKFRYLIRSSSNQESSPVNLSNLISELAEMAPECAVLEKCNDVDSLMQLLRKIRVFQLRLSIFEENIQDIRHEINRA